MSTPPQESMSYVPSPTSPQGATQTVLSTSESREGPPDASAVPTVPGTPPNVLSRLASSSTPHATSPPQQPVPDVSLEHPAEEPVLAEAPQRTADPTIQRPAPAFVSSHGGGRGGGRPITPPPGVARITRSLPTLPEIVHPLPHITIQSPNGGVQRRPTNSYPNDERAWRRYDDRDPFREKSVAQRLEPTIHAARDELFKATKWGTLTSWAQHIALGLQISIGALTTALGAALSGKHLSIAVAILGGMAILVSSFLARTKSSDEPQASWLRAKALDHFLREIEAFDLDHGHEIGDKWDDKIDGFRLGLEKILGNEPGSVMIHQDQDMVISPSRETWAGGGDLHNAGPSGYGKYHMTTKPGVMMV